MSISLKSIFSEKTKKSTNNSGAGKLRKILSKLSGAFMLPISVMSIAGLLLGVGAAIANNANSDSLKQFGAFIQSLGDAVFAGLPVLFAIAFVIAFTDDSGVAVFATLIGYLVFSSVQTVFITDVDKGVSILFSGAGRDPAGLTRLVGGALGFRALQTSVFGGIAVGLVVQYLYNRFHTIQLPQMISFYGGKRFVALITIPVMGLLAFVFLIFWPWIGIGLNLFGASLAKVPYGFESFIFGYIERSLIPFGLHHVFYAPLWFSSAGGDAGATIADWAKDQGIEVIQKTAEAANQTQAIYEVVASGKVIPGDSLKEILLDHAQNKDKFVGDSTASIYLLKFANTIDYTEDGKAVSIPLFTFLENQGFKVGRFADGKFSGMMFGLPAAAAAMIMAAPKENRKVTAGTVIPAAGTSFVTGVTEPIEFTFLFLSPLLFWGFHAFMMALSFMFANLAGVHIPMVFSGGVLDLLIYGAVPVQKGTNFWWVLVVGLAYAPIYYFVFLFVIKWKNLETPGRGTNTKLYTKSDYLARKDSSRSASSIDPQALAIVDGYGGIDNITNFNNCASRLRYDIKDLSLVDEQKLKAAGVVAIKVEGQHHVQAILGPIAEQMNAKINSQRDLIKALSQDEIDAILKNKPAQPKPEKVEMTKCENKTCHLPEEIYSPATGELIELAQVKDGVFSEEKLGKGFAIRVGNTGKKDIFSPINGQIKMVFATKHAIGFASKDNKTQVLIHIGIDTVELQGKGIEVFVEAGQDISVGDKVASVDLDYLTQSEIKNTDIIVVILHESDKKEFEFKVPLQNIDQLPMLVGQSLPTKKQ
ncbi:glucose PTS transporter subunit IIA [Mesomycoplasma ovipneumoniae]|uniref:Glucose PTS transporter subunit IIA n=1 Tax=Mesomycoplasma ovipneumoniae TaxID=29562 RepID=A0AAJ2P327_9BACT|nr:glucose PTS transporter subunit IIA [Mesomycoplasma ovipneumoniae]MDW2835281.1 glucose PTS transporter subunit IIA [Mesomycoplasma ovipneumoniae]MDW2860670.1 glucose PTS transporter subunit IIA [Mesomycoplasma ovipneumoniae]MDW2891852.1 glucose PTS transporter subunit IIA [Mesomycoplasma ovipneumoniae]MDW2892496.1 glucose PTS transporter subunit IIA [Mesomycoplasma ovipneumoniae]MDW2893238.1 glucose PTS transporter subunit IIA [Mesomycoplasma ovipneumoniae]